MGERHEFRNDEVAREVECENAWRAVCAKLGQPEAANVRAGGTLEQLHEQRKAMRRAVNAMSADIGLREITPQEGAAMAHASNVIARIETLKDGVEAAEARHRGGASSGQSWKSGEGHQLKLMRTADDFRAHYLGKQRSSDGRSTPPGSEGEMGIADFLRGVAGLPTSPDVRNALSIGTDTSGGYAVPSVVMPQILEALVPVSSLMRAGAAIVGLQQGAKSFTTAAINAIPTAAWRAENGAVAESAPTFRGVVAVPESLSFFFKVSRELLSDAANIGSALYQAIGQAFAKELDRAGLRGSGTPPEPRGILNTSGIQSVTNGANGTSLASYANILSAVQALLQADAPMPTASIMSPRSLLKLAGLVDTLGQPLEAPEILANVPMIATSQIPNNLTVGTSSDASEIYVGDFTKLAFMMREMMSIQVISELFAGNGQIAFMCHLRVDVALMYPAAFAVVTGVRA